MMQNLPNYIRLEGEQTFNILEELKELKFKTKRTFLSKCYSIFSFTLYFLTNIPIINERVSISLLVSTKKITKGQLDAVKCAKSLKSQGVISEDVVLMFDEIYCGEIIGANENNELYKGLLSFMSVGLKERVPYIIKSVPDKTRSKSETLMVKG